MSLYEQRLEMRGMRRSDIVNYFVDICSRNLDDRIFEGTDWTAEVGEEVFVYLGALKIPSTVVVFKSREKDILEKEVWAFRLKFMSAGG